MTDTPDEEEIYISTARETVGGGQYFVAYDEDQFLAYDDAGREFCYKTWEKKARPMGCTQLIVQLIPDDLFPTHGHEKPYVYFKREIVQADTTPYRTKVFTVVTIIPEAIRDMSDGEKLAVRAEAREHAKKLCQPGGEWHLNLGGTRIEEGKRYA